MEIKILVFGQLTDITHAHELSLSGPATSDDLDILLHQKFPALRSLNYRTAINKKIIQQTTPLKDGDTVALLPPFSGG